VLCGAGLGLRVWAGNPYHAIYDRNAFHLRPPAAAQSAPPHEPLPLVKLTGITTILPGKRALLLVDFPVRPREKPKEESYILAEGQRAGPIEVLSIDEKTAHVTVDESGTVTNLTFEKLTPATGPVPTRAVYRWGGQPYRGVYR
jgi:hypothetical protein